MDKKIKREEFITGLEDVTTELCIDFDHISIPVETYTKLVEDRLKLKLIEKAFLSSDSTYRLEENLSFLFGKKEEE